MCKHIIKLTLKQQKWNFENHKVAYFSEVTKITKIPKVTIINVVTIVTVVTIVSVINVVTIGTRLTDVLVQYQPY